MERQGSVIITTDLSFEVDVDGTVLQVSQDLTNVLGFTREEVEGSSLFLESSWAKSEEFSRVWSVLRSGVSRFVTMKLVGKVQQLRVQCCFTPLADVEGKVTTIKACCLDVTADVMRSLDTNGQVQAIRKSQGVMTFGLDGTIVDANDITLKSLGYTLEEVKGRHHRMFVSESYAESQEYAAFWERLRSGEFHAAEFKRLGKGGVGVWLQATYNPILDFDGRPVKIVKYSMDVTEQKLRNAKFSGQVEAIRKSQGVVTFAMDGTILDANDIFLKVIGYTIEEVKGRPHRMFLSPEYAASQEYAVFWARLRAGEFHAAEFTRVSRNGKEVWLQATYNPILDLDGRPVKIVKFAMDVTEQKKRYAEIDRQKSMFLANMSHEIRTPMNGIFGMLSLIKETQLEKDAQTYVDTCIRSADSLLAVLNDILLYSKAEAGALELEHIPFNLNSVVEDVLHIASFGLTPDKDFDISCCMKVDVPVFLLGDAARLRQLLLNLLSNAVKFTKYGEVSLDVAVVSKSPLLLKFDVSDTGIGISEEDQAHLFAPFSQADASITRQFGGTGLGLAICSHLAVLFGGKMSVQSRLGRGSTFSLTARFDVDLNCSGHSLADAFDVQDDVTVLKGVNVLVVDDNATNCMALETTLKHFGCRVVSARSGAEGIDVMRVKALKEDPIELCLLDYHMPHMSGIETARAIAKKGFTPKIVALASTFDRTLGLEPNILAFCVKPLRRGQLIHTICSVLQGRKLSAASSSVAVAVKDQVPDTENRPFHMFVDPIVSNAKLPVLVAEDNNTNRQVLSALLRQAWCDVTEAVNGVDAIDKLTDDIKVVLMDIHMPVMDGICATEAILKKRPDVDVIYVTADVSEGTKAKCNATGAVRMLLKPVNKSILISTLTAVLEERHKMLKQNNPRAAVNQRRCCLVVDDSHTNQVLTGLLARKVLGRDVEVLFADNGEAAVDMVREHSPDLVLMDVRMPGMSGIDATRQIRAFPLCSSIRIVGVTGANDDATIRECKVQGWMLSSSSHCERSNLRMHLCRCFRSSQRAWKFLLTSVSCPMLMQRW
jgi:PAS domain S-box-containing protein